VGLFCPCCRFDGVYGKERRINLIPTENRGDPRNPE
jgi:hypothetical protein